MQACTRQQHADSSHCNSKLMQRVQVATAAGLKTAWSDKEIQYQLWPAPATPSR